MAEQSGPLAGKVAVVMGVANQWSIGYAIAEALANAGAKLAITYRAERSLREASKLLDTVPGSKTFQCDVDSDDDFEKLGHDLKAEYGTIDVLVHSIAFAPPSELRGRFIETSREGFITAHTVSVYSLIAAAQRISPLMTNGGSIMTLSYLGADRVFPQYNVMGVAKAALESTVRYLAADLGDARIRVNALSAGPIKTKSARGIPGFSTMKEAAAGKSPIKGDFTAKQVADVAAFLASDAASGITGETIIIDNGFHVLGI